MIIKITKPMKMRYLKTFENFDHDDMGRFSGTDSDEQEWLTHIKPEDEEEEESGLRNEFDEEGGECPMCHGEGCPECKPDEEEEEGEEEEHHPGFRRKVWGDEVIEKKKFNFEKKKGEKKEDKKADKKEDKKDDKKETKGLSASQKKLPAGLQKAILAKKKK
jgi:hypothetical protein